MAHTSTNKKKLVARVRRIAGQIGAGLDIGHPYRDYAVTGRITRQA